jgi:N-acetylmuramoyl-L-alanine amidase
MRRTALLLITIFGLAGCGPTEEPMPEVVYDYGATIPPRQTPTPTPPLVRPTPSIPPASGPVPRSWMPSRAEKAWSAIIIHHSATSEGNAAIFDKWHREENGWNGVGYDFVIGNGSNSGDGEVEPTYRWRGQLTGAHTGGTAGNWANEEGIGICLVGDFNRTTPTSRQMDSLTKLVRFLQQRYHIPKNRVFGHGNTPGGHTTDCPGTRFPMSRLKANL